MTHSSEATSDARLIAQVRKVAAAPAALETVESKVGQKALINTATNYPLDSLRRADLMPDPEHPDETLALATARAVVYWARPTAGKDPHVVGLQVRADGTTSVFFAIVPPP